MKRGRNRVLCQEVGSHIAKTRKSLKLCQMRVAVASGVTRQHLSMIERGNAMPSIGVLYSLADNMGVDVRRLLPRSKDVTR